MSNLTPVTVGLDVHARSVRLAALRADELLEERTLPYGPEAIEQAIARWPGACACYEARPIGYGLQRHLAAAGIDCAVVAPALVPQRPGDRVKTDFRDARALARLHQGGLLEAIWVPDPDPEAARDLIRAREDARIDRMRDRHLPAPQAVSEFGSYGTGDGQLAGPWGMATDSEGNVWVADSSNHRVVEFNPSGGYIRSFGSYGSGNGQFSFPRGITVDAEGHVWVADTGNGKIKEFDSEGNFISSIGSWGTGDGQLRNPLKAAIDSEGNIWVADFENSRIEEFDAEGKFIRKVGSLGTEDGQFKWPTRLAIDPASGNVWVTDTWNHRIQVFGPEGEFIEKIGSPGAGPEGFNLPDGIAFFPSGAFVYILNSGNAIFECCKPRVEKWAIP